MSRIKRLRGSIISVLRGRKKDANPEISEEALAEEIADNRFHYVRGRQNFFSFSWVPGPILRFFLKPPPRELRPTLDELEKTGRIQARRRGPHRNLRTYLLS